MALGNVSGMSTGAAYAAQWLIAVPSQSGSLTYNGGNTLTPTWNDYIPSKIDYDGTQSTTTAGTFQVTFTPTTEYRWTVDGTNETKTVDWVVEQANSTIECSVNSANLTTLASTATVAVVTSPNIGTLGTLTAESDDDSIVSTTVDGSNIILDSVSKQ